MATSLANSGSSSSKVIPDWNLQMNFLISMCDCDYHHYHRCCDHDHHNHQIVPIDLCLLRIYRNQCGLARNWN